MDTQEAVLVINGHHKRLQQWDDLFAHHAANVLAPYAKKGKRFSFKDFKLYGNEQEDNVVDFDEAKQERMNRLRERSKRRGLPQSIRERSPGASFANVTNLTQT